MSKSKDVLQDQVTAEPGVSQAGVEVRRGDNRVKGISAHGYARSAKDPNEHMERAKGQMKKLVAAIQTQPKPNLPKSEPKTELEKGDVVPLFPNAEKQRKKAVRARNKPKPAHEIITHTGINEPYKGPEFLDEKGGHWNKDKGISQAGAALRDFLIHAKKNKKDPDFGRGVDEAKGIHGRILANMKVQGKPDLTRAEKDVHPKDPVLNPKMPPKAMDEKKRKDLEQRIMNYIKNMKKAAHEGQEKMKKDSLGFPALSRSEFDEVDQLLKSDYWSGRIKQVKAAKEAGRQKALADHFQAKGQEVPAHLKNPTAPALDYKKMNAQPKPAVKPAIQPSPVAAPTNKQGDKLFHPDISGTVDYKVPKKLTASEEKPDHSRHCAALKKMVGCLKKIDPITKLPGNLINKSGKDK